MEHERIRHTQLKMIEFCKDEDHQRTVLSIRDRTLEWRLYAGFLGIATKPICSGETENFTFAFEGILFKLYSKEGLPKGPVPSVAVGGLRVPDVKPAPPYPGQLEDDPAFETMIYAAQVSQSTGRTHVIYVDWRAVDMLEDFVRELTACVAYLKERAREAAVKARAEGQIINLFQDEEEPADGKA